ncbi:transcriptional regulator [Aliarcobacter trophiarum LMG 25534]|uniref:Transcriptional regulator n=1 Tax=Aliarcobacter trophiarum LMG 25534 TaxID=1032241 RepID=A0AAD0VMR4_9BACT|nr:metalloregulator ArsR/SmtB family transcription factor [Aliarcobacter trophiarum]AXK49171.1 transcriptional regulator, ArsR family [Aliarcobacter trophiarum LMG 25534]RXI25496.1 transcriptional regulator [Aliarcobacter trophiarum]RXJ89802.1 transcriptional regulator [Aliarcobacter trophiarum LMG 25534]
MGKLCCNDRDKEEIIENLVDEEVLYYVAELFKAFADSTRIKIISLLKDQRLCVNSISDILNISQSAISHQLKILKNAKIVKSRREGKWIFYSLDDLHIQKIFDMGLEHIVEGKK